MYVYASKAQLDCENTKRFNKFLEGLCSEVGILEDTKCSFKLVGEKTSMIVKYEGSSIMYDYILIIPDVNLNNSTEALFCDVLEIAKLSVSDPNSSVASVREYSSYIHVIVEGSLKTEAVSSELNILIVTKDKDGNYIALRQSNENNIKSYIWTKVLDSKDYELKVNEVLTKKKKLELFRETYLNIKNRNLENKDYEFNSFKSYIEALNIIFLN